MDRQTLGRAGSEAGAHGRWVETHQLLTGVDGNSGPVPLSARMETVLRAHGISCLSVSVAHSAEQVLSPQNRPVSTLCLTVTPPHPQVTDSGELSWRPQLACELQHLPEG